MLLLCSSDAMILRFAPWMRLLTVCFAVLVGLQKAAFASDYPCGLEWKYSALSGKCYKFFPEHKTWAEADAHCKTQTNADGARGGKTFLTKLESKEDVVSLRSIIGTNFETQWTAGFFETTSLGILAKWDANQKINFSLFDMQYPDVVVSTHKVLLLYEAKRSHGVWVFAAKLMFEDPRKKHGYFCEYKALSCDEAKAQLFNMDNSTMEFYPHRPTVSTLIHVRCKPGFYRWSERTPIVLEKGVIPKNYLNCSGMAAPNHDPDQFQPRWGLQSQYTEECFGVRCPTFDYPIPNVEGQPSMEGADSKNMYSYGHRLNVNCSLGYVSWLDKTKMTSYVRCDQSETDASKGRWMPRDYQPCVGIRCSMEELIAMVPLRGRIMRAIHRRTRHILSLFEMNNFNVFDNIVVFRCEVGFFFSDRMTQKTAICGVKDERDPNVGQWKGYQATTWPVPKMCLPVTCRHEDALPTDEYFMEPYFHIQTTIGDRYNVTSHDGNDYNYLTVLRFFCQEGYETANENNDINITCGPSGLWQPRLTACMEIKPKLDPGFRKHYVPPPQDAPEAKSVGVTVICIVILFFSFIAILDMSTFARDYKILKNNVRYLRKRAAARKAK